MSAPLATRCPACSTVFRVVPDQLRVSEGWVRCGRCAEVFDATESLVDLDTGAPRLWTGERPQRPAAPATPPGPGDATAGAAAKSAPDHEAEATDRHRSDAMPDLAGAGLAPLAPTEAVSMPAGPAPASAAIEIDFTAAPSALAASADLVTPATDAVAEAEAPRGPTTSGAAVDAAVDLRAEPRADAADMPSFVRRAERAQRWQRPAVRAALALLVVLALAGLAGQVVHTYRDLAAARFPQARPALEQACAVLGCRIEAARAIDALAVESSGLQRVEKSGVHQLSVALRNHAGIDVAMPALDLILTDTQGRLVARKVLLAADLGATAATIGAGREGVLQATLQIALPAGEPVAGYTIELFYP